MGLHGVLILGGRFHAPNWALVIFEVIDCGIFLPATRGRLGQSGGVVEGDAWPALQIHLARSWRLTASVPPRWSTSPPAWWCGRPVKRVRNSWLLRWAWPTRHGWPAPRSV